MKTNKEHRAQKMCNMYQESGNALIYVLVAIVLFGALSFTLARQGGGDGEAQALSEERVELYATQLMTYSAQVKSAMDQMLFIGTDVEDLDFIDPSDAGFNAGTQRQRADRVFHPEGGGITKGRLPDEIIAQNSTDPVAGWYMGRFNNIEWTPLGPGNTAGAGGTEAPFEDVILVAFQISQQVCERINETINGSSAIPAVTTNLRNVLIDDSFHGGANVELTTQGGTPLCASCDEASALCVTNGGQYAFYTVIADQ